jgi:hypothetical protein
MSAREAESWNLLLDLSGVRSSETLTVDLLEIY